MAAPATKFAELPKLRCNRVFIAAVRDFGEFHALRRQCIRGFLKSIPIFPDFR